MSDLFEATADIATRNVGTGSSGGGGSGEEFMVMLLLCVLAISGAVYGIIWGGAWAYDYFWGPEEVAPIVEQVEETPKEPLAFRLGHGTKNATKNFIKGVFTK